MYIWQSLFVYLAITICLFRQSLFFYFFGAITICFFGNHYLFIWQSLFVYLTITICLFSHHYLFIWQSLFVYFAITICLFGNHYLFIWQSLFVYLAITICLFGNPYLIIWQQLNFTRLFILLYLLYERDCWRLQIYHVVLARFMDLMRHQSRSYRVNANRSSFNS